ncbi:hypothetical protein WJ0W_006628 [Paenibacillus melissococcoides]|uniref:Uncharacterized protein n=1 Tax=Paenibacillus melissococcoides TaxID=2912268 RepID=A0ABM9GDU9_9BACL|nr:MULTISPECIES: hypothetical protein [Paenibacillus]MEB9893824.1 hypothetical protein [Bacillus cereus]CAH8249443.1 hypothetical protein WJ0W_006628 [Paenibacillus melissococcoides]CAH8721102.1 hypothetical protein WDD9_006128 [Paenibacillus melissococcoides]CAH8721434.1 hypothetical protein HTL2_006358 [Paenibacillus melissococcoides]GIO79887.1 hypothetical protein J6TS7_34970 [Paenibacillus dendritiformis]
MKTDESPWIAAACDADRNTCQLTRYLVFGTVGGAQAWYEALREEVEEA